MATIKKPQELHDTATSISKYLEIIESWHTKSKIYEVGFHSRVWYRGHSQDCFLLQPGVYRDSFTEALSKDNQPEDLEERRLHVETSMHSDFRSSGANFFNPTRAIDLYFTAQHYGMPTRLLDWTTNPLAGLFFACEKDLDKDGEVIVMNCLELVLPTPENAASDYPRWVVTMRHPYCESVIGMSYWQENKSTSPRLIVPIRPDNLAGRISQQSSCFTLHAHQAEDKEVKSLVRIQIPGKVKDNLRKELSRLNINQFTIYNDLDHLSQEIKRSWDVK